MKIFIQQYRIQLIFLAFLLFLFMAYRYPHSIQKGPQSIHMWRQADCYSFALNYFEEGHKFFQPAIHWSGGTGNGKTVSEFPIIYFAVSLAWKVFGQHAFIFRLLNMLILYTGLFYLFRFLQEFLEDDYWSIYIPILLFTSPVLVYYTNNFLMNAPALGLVLIAIYHYWKYLQSKKLWRICTAMAFFLLAGLLKMTALLLFVALLIIHIAGLSPGLRKKLNIPITGPARHLLPYLGVMAGIALWLAWSAAYNRENISGVFLRGLYPIWKVGLYKGLDLGTSLYATLLPSLFNHTALLIILGLFVWLLIKRKNVNPEWLLITTLVAGGSLAFILLFYQAFSVHDYYLINLLVFIPLVAALFLDYLKRNKISLFYSRSFRTLAGVALFFLLYHTAVNQRIKYDPGDTFIKHTIIVRQNDKAYWRNIQEVHSLRFEDLENITPYLRSLGISRNDKVISLPDGSPNITLSLMDQKGYTDFGFNDLSGEAGIRHFIESGARFLVISEPALISQDYLAPFLSDKMGQYKNISIYRLQESR